MNLDFNFFLEIFGYIGTALVIFSMLMTSVVKLRIFNICGSSISMIYAIITNTWPIVLLNASLILINVIQLIRMSRAKVTLSRVSTSLSDPCTRYFLSLYGEDIKRFFPEYTVSENCDCSVHMAYIDSEAVGIIIGQESDGEMTVCIDYAIPKYRDLSVSSFLFSRLEEDGIKRLHASTGVEVHKKYLIRMGFTEADGYMTKEL